MLDILVVAPHPDDAELGMAGTIMRAKEEGFAGGHPGPHQRRTHAAWLARDRARETAAATKILNVDWRENLGLVNRKLEHTLASAGPVGRCFSPRAAAADLRPLLGRFASRSCRRHGTDRGGSLLVEAHQERSSRASPSFPRGFSTTSACTCAS